MNIHETLPKHVDCMNIHGHTRNLTHAHITRERPRPGVCGKSQ